MSLIVVMDDRAAHRARFVRLASALGADVEVKSFEDASAALTFLLSASVDLAIVAYSSTTQMIGADFLRAFRESPQALETPVIVVCAQNERAHRLSALEAGAADFLVWPVDHDEFVTRSRNLLGARQRLLALKQQSQKHAQEAADLDERCQRIARQSHERLAQVIDAAPIMIHAVDPRGVILFANAAQCRFYGAQIGQAAGKALAGFVGADGAERNAALDRLIYETGNALPPYEEGLSGADARRRSFLTHKTPLRGEDGTLDGVLTCSIDITAGKRTEQRMRYLAHHDALTGLENRALLLERMRQAIARTQRGGDGFALHLIDLDSFKSINDVRGHSIGDLFLISLARRLRESVREIDTLARLGGDEFAILQAEVASSEDIAEFSSRIAATIAGHTDANIAFVRVTGSIGVAVHPRDGRNSEELLRNADLAMYKAKEEGGDGFCFFADELQERAVRLAHLGAALRQAIEREEFELHYQPQYDLKTNELAGVEALLRWRHPQNGLIAPKTFLHYAEDSGLIAPINEWALRSACRQAALWRSAGAPDFRVAVNLCSALFGKRRLPDFLFKLLEETRLDPKRLELEIAETVLIEHLDALEKDMREIGRFGVTLTIADFGVGLSSLACVKRLPVRRLKINQDFVRNMTKDANDASIVRAILSLGHTLDLEIVAEGVETLEQLAWLRREACQYGQGFLFGAPEPAEAIEARFHHRFTPPS